MLKQSQAVSILQQTSDGVSWNKLCSSISGTHTHCYHKQYHCKFIYLGNMHYFKLYRVCSVTMITLDVCSFSMSFYKQKWFPKMGIRSLSYNLHDTVTGTEKRAACMQTKKKQQKNKGGHSVHGSWPELVCMHNYLRNVHAWIIIIEHVITITSWSISIEKFNTALITPWDNSVVMRVAMKSKCSSHT